MKTREPPGNAAANLPEPAEAGQETDPALERPKQRRTQTGAETGR